MTQKHLLNPKLWLLLCAAILQGCMAANVGHKSGGEANENIYLDCEVDAAQLMEIEAEVYGDVPSDLAFFKHADPRFDGRHFMNSDRRGCYWNFVGERFYVSTTKRTYSIYFSEVPAFWGLEKILEFYKTRDWSQRNDWFVSAYLTKSESAEVRFVYLFNDKRLLLSDSKMT